ncbi:hypothetical protein AURDEDRAFT_155163 [Auricularia subglabra TFB-10046 SS5]|nr:hypothetical protein AURDEDRAFT_155163 [Auricularia subglabra TFB-10046 SS5]
MEDDEAARARLGIMLDTYAVALAPEELLNGKDILRMVPIFWRALGAILAAPNAFPNAVTAIEDLARSVVQSSTTNMLLAQQAELKKLTAEVGALKGARSDNARRRSIPKWQRCDPKRAI